MFVQPAYSLPPLPPLPRVSRIGPGTPLNLRQCLEEFHAQSGRLLASRRMVGNLDALKVPLNPPYGREVLLVPDSVALCFCARLYLSPPGARQYIFLV